MSERIYLDNAATTQVDPQVVDAMLPYLTTHYGNPSSIHSLGREARLAVEQARKTIAGLLGVKPSTIFFTSGGTESNNMAVLTALRDLGCNHIITSKVEHHAVLHTIEHYAQKAGIGISYVKLFENGGVDQNDLQRKLENKTGEGCKCLVSLMHANNETGQFTEASWVAATCRRYGAIFHSDCVQTIGHYPLRLDEMGMDMASASAHKFHGPKGVGLLYVREDLPAGSLIHGGGQERGRRAGTENVAGIVGMAKALQLFYECFAEQQNYILGLKSFLASALKDAIPGIVINSGRYSLYAVLSVSFPKNEHSEMLLMELDQRGICAAGGSACSGGGSHVMKELGRAEDFVTIRFSFSRQTGVADLQRVVAALKEILAPAATLSEAVSPLT